MSKINNNNEYCIYCGTKNKKEDKKCKKCKKKLNPKDRPLLEYLKSKIKDDLKGNIEDNIINIITKYIKSHLYGFILTCSIIITTTCVITNIIEDNHIEIVTKKPSLSLEVINACEFENSKSPSNKCPEGYLLEETTCTKTEETEAISNNICQVGFYQSGNSCISNTIYNKITKEECLLPNDGAFEVYVSDTGECMASYCADELVDGVCGAGSSEPIEFTVTEYCPDGTSEIDGSCRSISNMITEYSCEEGTLEKNKCIITLEEPSYIGCDEGYILNEECNLCVKEES